MLCLPSVLLLMIPRGIRGFHKENPVDGVDLRLVLITGENPLGTSTEAPKSQSREFSNCEADCCCFPENQPCQPNEIGLKIFNTEREENFNNTSGCPTGHYQCCTSDTVRLSKQNGSCISPERWVQQCQATDIVESGVRDEKLCGTRSFEEDKSLPHGEASVGEFPWTCVLLNQDDEFLGTCAIIPKGKDNHNSQGTDKVITAASKLNIQEYDLLKVRVGHYERNVSSGETQLPNKEYIVTRFRTHPDFDKDRLTNNIAVLQTQTIIDMTSDFVNTVCLPSCSNQFDFIFRNGTGSRCWVMGWGAADHSNTPQRVPRKVDVPLVNTTQCNSTIVDIIQGGNKYAIHTSEMCAGGEEGKDACVGDGGSPLVCQGEEGRWTVVGLVSWGVGECGKEGVPGVYVNIAHFKEWIETINF